MQIIKTVRHKVCTDGALMREVMVDIPITDEFIDFLRSFGTVMTIGTMGPGCFKYEWKKNFSIKGWIGDATLEIRYRKEVMDLCEEFVEALFCHYHNGKPDIEILRQMEEKICENLQNRENQNIDG